MIVHSPREMDTTFVSNVIKHHNLNPAPVPGFHAQPDYWQETPRWRRVIERYNWGAVLFLDDRQSNLHSTVLAVGDVDLVHGRVVDNGASALFPVSWYHDLAQEFKDVKTKVELSIPSCIGFHEFDYVCDGGVNPNTKKAEPACAWKRHCIALQGYCVETGRYQEDVIKRLSPEQIVQAVTRMAERAPGAPLPVLPEPPVKRAAAGKPAGSGAKSKPAPAQPVPVPAKPVAAPRSTLQSSAPDLDQMIDAYLGAAAAEVGMQLSEPKPGNLYIVDRTDKSDYKVMFQATDKPARPRGIVVVRVRKRMGLFHLQFRVAPEFLTDTGLIPQSEIQVWRDTFPTIVQNVVPGTERANNMLKVIARVIQSGQ